MNKSMSIICQLRPNIWKRVDSIFQKLNINTKNSILLFLICLLNQNHILPRFTVKIFITKLCCLFTLGNYESIFLCVEMAQLFFIFIHIFDIISFHF